MNEAEVRFSVIDPLLRRLGYQPGATNGTYMLLEEQLTTPLYHIGRKSKKDFPIGKPDYRCGIKGRNGCFIVESKAENQPISEKDVGQAHSYAAHTSVGANLFVLCNGVEIRIYKTLEPEATRLLLKLSCEKIDSRYHEIENFLGPTQLRRLSEVKYEQGLKLSDELPPSLSITSGKFDVLLCELDIKTHSEALTELVRATPQMAELEKLKQILLQTLLAIEGGTVGRDEQGRILAALKFLPMTKSNAFAMQALDIEMLSFSTDARFLPSTETEEALFEAELTRKVAKGSKLFPLYGDPTLAEVDMVVDAYIAAHLYIQGETILGDYTLISEYIMPIPVIGDLIVSCNIYGSCQMRYSF